MDVIEMLKDMGLRIKKARGKLTPKVSQEKMVDLLNESEKAPLEGNDADKYMELSRYRQWENGYNPIDVRWIPAICDVCKCDVGYLFGMYESQTNTIEMIRTCTGLSELAVESLLIAASESSKQPIPEEILCDNLRHWYISRFAKIRFVEALLENTEEWKQLSVCAYDYLREMRNYQIAPSHKTNGIRHDQLANASMHSATLHLSKLFENIFDTYKDEKFWEWK